MDYEKAIERIRAMFDKAIEADDSQAWEAVAGEQGDNYEAILLALSGIEGHNVDAAISIAESDLNEYLAESDED